jgi:glycosyltransferase involved in cell wall biosynthesis
MMFILILMIKNEEKILRRCLESVENLVDHFCITDTGSTDNSVAIAEDFLRTHKGKVFNNEWQNFGHNRSLSFSNAREYLTSIECDLTRTYGLLLDADMVFMQGTLRDQELSAIGYKFIQANGNLEYYNTRLVRMDHPWTCVGVTHEYWNGHTEAISKSVCYIDDQNDGGCKSDKFQRDERLLVKGVEDEPTNVRYVFYLAQTYKCLSKWKEAITMYKKRISMGGWIDEVWYSMYMIGLCYKSLNNIHKFEYWMQKAFDERPCRSEPVYELTKYFRETSKHHKAYYYYLIGSPVKFPENDVLFVDKTPYEGGFLYEKTILDYYIHTDKSVGVSDCFNYLLNNSAHASNVVSNLKFYITPIRSTSVQLDIPLVFGDNFHPSAVSVYDYPNANVRFVNYLPPVNGDYITRDGSDVVTRNAKYNIETKEYSIVQENQPLFESNVKGLEDMRVYKVDGKLYYTATNYYEYIKGKIAIVHGEYGKTEIGLDSPFNLHCEKNWLHVKHHEFIYSWHPLRIGVIEDNIFKITQTIETPPLFSLFRGSASPVVFNEELLVLVHFVEYSKPRKYYHCFVKLSQDYKLIAVSLPFFFRENAIEYCISVVPVDDGLACFVTLNDSDPHAVLINYSDLEWINV